MYLRRVPVPDFCASAIIPSTANVLALAPRARVMSGFDSRHNALEAELAVLRAMCLGTAERSVWADGIALLADYSFQDDIHQLVFDALGEISSSDYATIREQLPTRLNNKGFPDLDWEKFFEPHNLSADQAMSLMRAVRSNTSTSSQIP